jgi:ABC-type antimicrobial peptide transport system permease subunit
LRRQRAFEGVVLALMGAVLAIPLGWLPVTAARLGADSNLRSAQRDHLGSLISLPGWEVIPILLAPAVLAAVLWTVFPALGAAIRTARHPGPTDELLPRF